MRIALLHTIVRVEEKLLIEEAKNAGIILERLDDRSLLFDLSSKSFDFDLVFDRSISHNRSIYTLKLFEEQGITAINSSETIRLCGDKILTSAALESKKIPTPRTLVAFNAEQALNAIESVGYPAVLKPVVGSWARLLAKINDREAAEALVEHKSVLGSAQHQIFYIQEYIKKPDRDIRAFVVGDETIAAIYRSSPHWITNTARGGKASNCEVTDELNELCLKSAAAVGNGILAIDLMETDGKYVVHEVNHTMEFRNSIAPTGVNIPKRMIEYVVQEAKS